MVSSSGTNKLTTERSNHEGCVDTIACFGRDAVDGTSIGNLCQWSYTHARNSNESKQADGQRVVMVRCPCKEEGQCRPEAGECCSCEEGDEAGLHQYWLFKEHLKDRPEDFESQPVDVAPCCSSMVSLIGGQVTELDLQVKLEVPDRQPKEA
ncbi:hypothetical protein KCV07_g36, partial [Aureobasidium melanogenum]